MHVEVISTEDLGDRSYLVHDGTSAVVVDPQRDVDRVEKMLADLGVQCAMVVETHIHNDYVTGGFDLAMRNGCPYVVNAADDVSFARLAVSDGDELTVGAMTIRVMATPGHTDTHLSYVISEGEQIPAVFTGGSLLYGSVGRTDLVDVGRTEELTRAQYHSARRLAAELPDAAPVYPTHGFGSFCSAGSATGSAQELSAGLPPASYPRRTFAELPGDAVLLDVRRDDEHATDHIPGAAHVPMHHLL
ncbi:MAG: MBL fold metallo-hydrolase, partial [Mycobacterium sp.]